MRDTFNKELKTDKIYFTKWVYLIFFGLLLGIAAFGISQNTQFTLKLAVVSGLLILTGIALFNEKTSIRLVGNELIIEHTIFGKLIPKYFDIKRIENLSYRKHVKSNFYSSKGEIRVMGIDATPESWKEYYYHNEIISFNYDGKKIEIGKWKKEFEAKQLYNLIRQKNDDAQH